MFGWIKNALGAGTQLADPFEQFVRDFVEESRRQNMVPTSYDPQERSFTFSRAEGGDMKCHLDNVFRAWRAAEQSGRAEVIGRFVQSIVETTTSTSLDPQSLPRELMPGIRSHSQISDLMIRNWIAGAPVDDANATAFLPFLGDMVACTIRDLPNSMSPMTRATLADAEMPLQRAMELAMTNFRTNLPAPVFQALGDGLFGCNNLEDYQSALLLLKPGTDYALPPLQGVPVALVPGRNLFYLTGSANLTGLGKLLDLAESAGQTAHFCSSVMMQWDGDRWTEFHFRGGDDRAVRQREIARAQLATDYDSQKQLLDQYYIKCGLDIVVNQQMLFRRKDTLDTISVTTLASATTGALLPRADRVSFVKQVVNPESGLAQKAPDGIVDVPWSDAMAIVGHLFEPVAHVYPPRVRALGFPDADARARLTAAAAASPAVPKP